jgi:hypothetical protein
MSLLDAVASPSLPEELIELGPWEGSMRSVSADQVPPEFLATGTDFHFLPRSGTWKRRLGQTQKFDTFGAAVGMLPFKGATSGTGKGMRCRQLEEFPGGLVSDGVPTLMALLTTETIAVGLDDGRFSTVWIRDQVNSMNYTLCSEYASTTYPAPGTVQTYRVTPLWYDSGDGGITRGASEFARRFLVSGSRKFARVGNEFYFPSLSGTPSRWNGQVGSSAFATIHPVACTNTSIGFSPVGDSTLLACIDDVGADTAGADYDRYDSTSQFNDGLTIDMTNTPISRTSPTVRITMRADSGYDARMRVDIGYTAGGPNAVSAITWGGPANTETTAPLYQGNVTTAFVRYSYTLSAAEAAALLTSSQLRISIYTSGVPSGTKYFDIAQVEFISGSTNTIVNRLLPTGPIPPCHAGYLTKGNLVAGSSGTSYALPDGDSVDGSWLRNDTGTAVDLYSVIDESPASDTDYIKATSTTGCKIRLADFTFIPAVGDSVSIQYRARRVTGIGAPTIQVDLMEGTTVIATDGPRTLPTSFALQSLTLTPTQFGNVSNWAAHNLYLQISSGNVVLNEVDVSWAALVHTAGAVSQAGGWRGHDRFYNAIGYVDETGAIWQATTPRAPNTLLPNGLNLFTVDVGNADARYDKLTWTLPIPPSWVKQLALMRTTKINSTTDDNLQLNPRDLRIVDIVKAGTATYEDYYADDLALTLDPAKLFVRSDHQMPWRTRYLFAGDSRACGSYGAAPPPAIVLAPVGRSADWDLNVAEDAATAYAQSSMYARVKLSSAGVGVLELVKSDGTTLSTVTLTFGTGAGQFATIEALVDRINATSVAVDGQQWRAQICPKADAQAAPVTALLPHIRTIASCVVDNTAKTIALAAGGLSKVAVGAYVSGSGVTVGAYITRIDSDTQLTFTGTITTGTKDLNFYFELGDDPKSVGAPATVFGYQRIIANSWAGFLYFNNTYLSLTPDETSSVWMTVASPGSVKSAANCWSSEIANKHTPPTLDAGISMGGVAVDNGFVVPFANKLCVIRNTREQGSGIDADYHLYVLDDAVGCCAWQSVCAAHRGALLFSPEGWIACDLFSHELISRNIYLAPDSDAASGVGDFAYEAPLCVAATAADTDAAYLSGRVLRNALWCSYRASGSHPNRQVVLRLGSRESSAGLMELLRGPGRKGWSLPLVRSVTALAEGRRTDGSHLYGWNEENAGSAGDGRIDEIETGTTDNGVAISATATSGWLRSGRMLAAQEIEIEHSSPTGATVALDFVRGVAAVVTGDTYTMTPTLSSTLLVMSEVKMLPLAARVQTRACYLSFRQSAGSPAELRSLKLKVKRLLHAVK